MSRVGGVGRVGHGPAKLPTTMHASVARARRVGIATSSSESEVSDQIFLSGSESSGSESESGPGSETGPASKSIAAISIVKLQSFLKSIIQSNVHLLLFSVLKSEHRHQTFLVNSSKFLIIFDYQNLSIFLTIFTDYPYL